MRKYWWLLILPALLVLWWGLDHRDASVTVHVTPVTRGHIESTVSTNGKADPAEWAAAHAETQGTVRTVNVQRGQKVKAGEVLVTLDTTAERAELAAAIARRQEAQNELTIAQQGGRSSQRANLDSALRSARIAVEVAERNYASQQRLAAQNAATKLSVQEAKDALDRARQALAGIEAQRQALVTSEDKSAAAAKLRDAEAAVALAEHRLSLSTVRAPIDGTLYEFDLKVGAYLQPGMQVGLVGNIDEMKVTVYVDEPDLGRVSLGIPVVITWDARPGQKWTGRVEKLPTEVVALGTRSVGEVTTIVENPNHDLLPGVTVNVTLISKVVDNALLIPKGALRNMRGQDGVFRLSGNTLQWVPVQAGISDVNNVQVLSGLREGEQVADRVVEPSDAEITNGLRVRAVTD